MKKTIFWLHLVTGVLAGVIILVMSVTGVLLMYQRQITEWADRDVAKISAPGTTRLPVETLLAKLRETEGTNPASISIQRNPNEAASFSFGRERVVFADPYTGAVTGEGSTKVRAFFRLMIDWHRWLGTGEENRSIGKAITGACNLGFLFLVVSGFYLWWPRRWNRRALRAITVFDSSLSGKARDWNWHNAAGFWSAIPLFFVVFTATFFSYPWATELLYRATGNEPPPKPAPRASAASTTNTNALPKSPSSEAKPSLNFQGLNAHWTTAEKQVADWQTITLRLPGSTKAPLNFTIDRGIAARPDLRAQLTINSQTGAVEKWEPYSSYNSARQIRMWIRWLHTGEAGGFVGQTIAGLASGAGALLVWTGLALAYRRFFKPRREAAT